MKCECIIHFIFNLYLKTIIILHFIIHTDIHFIDCRNRNPILQYTTSQQSVYFSAEYLIKSSMVTAMCVSAILTL